MKQPLIVRFLKRTGISDYYSLRKSIGIEGDPGVLREERKKFTARWGEKIRPVGYSNTPLGRIRRTESAGPDKRKFRIALDREATYVPATVEGIKAVVRRIRPEDEAELSKRDAEIAALSEALRDLQIKRLDYLHESFQRGHVVTLKELTEMAEAKT